MGKKKASPADTYRPQMEAANAAAAAPAPQVQKVDEYTSKLWDMYSGKETFDISKLPNASALNSLYKNAIEMTDKGKIGRGLLLGDGSNSAQLDAIREQDAIERQMNAKGELEERVADTFSGLPERMLALGGINQDNRNNAYGRTAQMYGMEINRPQQKKWWETLLGAGATVASGGLSSIFNGSKQSSPELTAMTAPIGRSVLPQSLLELPKKPASLF